MNSQLKALLAWIKDEGQGGLQKKRRRRFAVWTLLALLAYSIFGGDQGLVSLASSWHEEWALKREITQLQASNSELEAKQQALRSDRAAYEKTAREKLFLKNPGDLIYRFEGKP
jgi:cell division protein FtsB